ncbi:MAG: amino-acid N-acetyltransferase [Gammaproteobacteria bacterium]|nr:amino-acid N-acetyltransferase [Gammaproteobacteria bacterium]
MNKITDNNQQQFIDWFRQSSPYIHSHRKRTFVIFFGGDVVQGENFAHFINDISLLNSLGVRLVLVHGARQQIEKQVSDLGLSSSYVENLRITDSSTLPAVEQAVGQVRVNIEARLSMGLINTPMSGASLRVVSGNYVTARPYGVRNGVDYCHTGEVRKVDTNAIRSQLELGNITLLSPIGYSPSGEVFNLHAEEVATEAAIALKADKLIMMTSGFLHDKQNELITQLDINQAKELLLKDCFNTELQSHLNNATQACERGVKRAHLINHLVDGSLLIELYSRDGCGTLVSAEQYEGLRTANIDDVGGILEIIKPMEDKGILAQRTREQLELDISRFSVIERDGMIIACASMYPYAEESMAEVACLAVHPDYRNAGRGDMLLQQLETQARKQNMQQLFLLTTHTAHWFIERGFIEQNIDNLPVSKKCLYNLQRNSKIFIKNLY